MNNQWLWFTVPLGVLCLVAVVYLVRRLVVGQSTAVVSSMPLVPEQQLEINADGPMLLHGEGPRMTRAFGKLDYRLTNPSGHSEIPLSNIWFRSSSSGLSKSRLSLRSFDVLGAGRYRLEIIGLSDPPPDDAHRIVITRDNRARLTATIVALVFAGIGLIASLVLSSIVVLMNQ